MRPLRLRNRAAERINEMSNAQRTVTVRPSTSAVGASRLTTPAAHGSHGGNLR
jgi:hypothetical protein